MRRGRIVLAAVAVVLVVLLLFFLAIRPQRSQLADVRAQIETEETRTIRLRAELAHLRELQANAPELEAQLSRIRRFVPRRAEVPNFIFQVQEAANAAGLDFVEITPDLPKDPPEGAALAEVRMNIGAKGGYFAVQDFIRRLYRLDRAVRIDHFGLSGDAIEGGTVRLGMTSSTRIFFELPPDRGATTTLPSGTPTPGATPTPTTTP